MVIKENSRALMIASLRDMGSWEIRTAFLGFYSNSHCVECLRKFSSTLLSLLMVESLAQDKRRDTSVVTGHAPP